MMITVEDRRAFSAEVTVDMVSNYLQRTGWSVYEQSTRYIRWALPADGLFRKIVHLPRPAFQGFVWVMIQQAVDDIAKYTSRQPSQVLSDIVGYQVGLGQEPRQTETAATEPVEAPIPERSPRLLNLLGTTVGVETAVDDAPTRRSGRGARRRR